MVHGRPEEKSDAGLKTRHVFLDTQVYRQYGHSLNAKVLQVLLKHIENHVCTLHITDITKLEIKRQIEEMAAELAHAVNKANSGVRWQVARFVPD